MIHITLVSVTTEAKVPISTATDLAQRQLAHELADQHRNDEGSHGRKRGRDQKWRVVQLRERGFRHDPEQQRRERRVEQEKIHPGQAGVGQALGLAAGKADEDQAEIGYGEINDIDHFGVIFSSQRLISCSRCVISCSRRIISCSRRVERA
jgi:hypothetical protein